MKNFKSDFFNAYTPSSHPRHGTDARTTYIRMLMRGYIKERSLIDLIKTKLATGATDNIDLLENEYACLVHDMKLCFKRLLSRQEHANKEMYQKKDRIAVFMEKIQELQQENKRLLEQINVLSEERKMIISKNN